MFGKGKLLGLCSSVINSMVIDMLKNMLKVNWVVG